MGFNILDATQIGGGQSGDVVKHPRGINLSYRWDISELASINLQRKSRDGQILLKSCELPNYTSKDEVIESPSIDYTVSNRIQWNDINIEFYDLTETTSTLITYMQDTWSHLGISTVQLPDTYKFRSTIRQLMPNGLLSRSWVLVNSWVKGMKFSQLTYETSDVTSVALTISYDWAYINGTGNAGKNP